MRLELAELAAALLDHVETQGQLLATGVAGSSLPPAAQAQPLPGTARDARSDRPAAARGLAPARPPQPARPPVEPPAPPGRPLQPSVPTSVAASAPAPTRDRPADPAAELARLGAVASACTRCRLAGTRTKVVFGTGSVDAELVFVGEAPGHNEDLSGEPFVGDAGQLLDKIILAMGLTRGQVYICNVIKCRPPSNRTPRPDELESCEPYLVEQLGIVQPKVVVALGTHAAQTLLRTNEAISRLRGKFFRYHEVELMPTYHPAYLLRNPQAKRVVWEDMQKVQEKLGIPPGNYAEKGPYKR